MSQHHSHPTDPEHWKPYLFILCAVASMFIIFGIFVVFAVSVV